MKLREFCLLTDENIDPEVVAHLRQIGFDVLDVVESGLQGSTDVDLLRLATAQDRIVVTHDSDFGTLAIHQNEPLTGVLYLPRQAVFERDARPVVYAGRPGAFAPVEITITHRTESWVVVEGVDEGTEVALVDPTVGAAAQGAPPPTPGPTGGPR